MMSLNCEKCRYNSKCHNDISFIQLDSYIEKCFYEKCCADSSCGVLLLDWIDSKSIYVSYTGLSRTDYGNYSKHDASHSIAILNAIASVLGRKKIQLLSATDLWLLLHCAYGHDMGMPFSYEQMMRFWEEMGKSDSEFGKFFRECLSSEDTELYKAANYINNISKKIGVILKNGTGEEELEDLTSNWPVIAYRYTSYVTAEFVRTNHAKRSKEIIDSCDILQKQRCSQIESRFYKIIANCCSMHTVNREDVLQQIEKHEWDIEGESCHPRFIAYMLRLGDLLDIGNNRFDAIGLMHYGKLPKKSMLHKKKHDAIEHIKYTEEVIEITARSNDEEVCQVANDWFECLKEEVRFLVTHWTEFAPEVLGGCTLSEPQTKVYLDDKIFYRIEDCEFKVDKNTLIDLVIGRNLYKTQFDFMKEYIQNAMDAVKMRFWIDVKDGNLDYFILDEMKVKSIHKSKLLPFDFEKNALKQYALEVICEYIEKLNPHTQKSEDMIRIEIIDKGIGIDKECIEAISNIGSGWRRRKRYAAYLETMPKWLKPTGGFGIGMQSGFMISDEIHIETKSEIDRQGKQIGLFSNNKNGRIEERDCSIRTNGTKIRIDVPYSWFMNMENYKEYPDLAVNVELRDFMDPVIMAEAIVEFIKSYLKTILGCPLFPVNVKQRGRKATQIICLGDNEYSSKEEFYWNGEIYNIFEISEESTLMIWDCKDEILCQIKLDDDSSKRPEEKWYFKGVRVWTDTQDKNVHNGLYKYIGDFSIDIMGLNVKDCLTIDRNRFKNGFDYRGKSDLYAVIALNYLAEKEKLLIEPLSGRKILRCILAYKFFTEQGRQHVREKIDEIPQEYEKSFIKRNDMLVWYQNYKKDSEEKNIIKMGTLFEMCKNLYFDNTLRWNESCQIEDIAIDALEDNIGIVWNTSSDRENKIMSMLRSLLDKIYLNNYRFYTKVKSFGDESVREEMVLISEYLETKENKNLVVEDKRKVFERVPGCRQIYTFNSDFYPQLHVLRIPFSSGGKRKDNSNLVISPIPALYSDSDLAVTLKDKDDTEEYYMHLMTENRHFTRLINWVYDYQKEAGKYSKDEIKEAYISLIKYIYDEYILPEIKGLR